MIKKLVKLLLAASLAFSGAVCLNGNNQEVNANEVQPYAQISSFVREIETTEWMTVTDGTYTEYVRIRFIGQYTHNIENGNQYPTNISMKVLVDSTSYVNASTSSDEGHLNITHSNTEYSCSNGKLNVTVTVFARRGSTSNGQTNFDTFAL